MGSFAPPVSFLAPQHPLRPKAVEEGDQRAQPEQQRLTEFAATMKEPIAATNLVISYDESADRFVQTLTDANTAETLRKYPSDFQLAYSRAVMAYLRAQVESVNKP
ncbi:MAG: hypothetical protein QM759_05905 [Terricaulis sp.]